MADADIDIARDEMAKSLIDMCSFEVTLPLSDKTKNIHTNSFIYFEPVPQMEAMENIYENMGRNKSTRYVFFRKGYWYVKDVKISYSDDKQEMKLTLSPFPTVFEKQDMSGSSSSGKSATKVKTKKETKTTDDISAPEDFSKADKEWAESIVRKAIGTKKDPKSRAIAIDKAFKSHIFYNYYECCYYTRDGKNFKNAWSHGLNCADGANVLTALFRTAGLNADILHGPHHFFVRLKIDGKTYYTDNAAKSGNHTSRAFGSTWKGMTSGSKSEINSRGYVSC